jgi:hypothetical protein
VRGVTPSIYYGHDGQPGLVDFVTAGRGRRVNINTASEIVLQALGCSTAEIIRIMQSRRVAPIGQAQVCGTGFDSASGEFRIEAEGRIDGHPRARVTAIVTRNGADAEIRQWDPNAEARPAPGAP